MKSYPVREPAKKSGGEYVLGMKDLKTHACYLIYGELKPGESGRKVCPGGGHEEILLAVVGDLTMTGEKLSGVLPEGSAVHLQGEESCTIGNPGSGNAIYVMAGGHGRV